MNNPQSLFGDLPVAGGDIFHFFRVTLVDGIQHLQNFHVMARRANQRVIIVRHMGNRCGVNVIVVKTFTGVLHAVSCEQDFGSPRDILMAQAGFEMETMFTDKVVAIDIQPGDVEELTRIQRHL